VRRLVGITGIERQDDHDDAWRANCWRAPAPADSGRGNIGAPLISLVDTSRDDGFTVIELLSSFQLEAVERLASVRLGIINITPDHLTGTTRWRITWRRRPHLPQFRPRTISRCPERRRMTRIENGRIDRKRERSFSAAGRELTRRGSSWRDSRIVHRRRLAPNAS